MFRAAQFSKANISKRTIGRYWLLIIWFLWSYCGPCLSFPRHWPANLVEWFDVYCLLVVQYWIVEQRYLLKPLFNGLYGILMPNFEDTNGRIYESTFSGIWGFAVKILVPFLTPSLMSEPGSSDLIVNIACLYRFSGLVPGEGYARVLKLETWLNGRWRIRKLNKSILKTKQAIF